MQANKKQSKTLGQTHSQSSSSTKNTMFLKSFAFLLTIGTALALMPSRPAVNADMNILDILLQSRAIGDPALQQYCFNRYNPKLKEITDQYETDYNACFVNYLTETSEIDAKYKDSRDGLSRSAKETCAVLQKCDDITGYVDAFDCFAVTGSKYKEVLFTLSEDAKEYGTITRELYRVAESTAEFCISFAERTYWEDTNATKGEMTKCLNGEITEPSSTTTRKTTEPATTTWSPSTIEPTDPTAN